MNIGVPRERRPFEYRVGLFPAGVKLLTQMGNTVYVEHDAGLGAGFSDQDYSQAGGQIVYTPHEVFGRADLLLKVARPLVDEIEWMRPKTALAGLLHLGSSRREKIDALQSKRITAIAYEHITLKDGTVPIRRPLSEVGGTLAAQIGARLLQVNAGGKGILLSGVPGVPPAEVVILGAGMAGTRAAQTFYGMGAHLTILDSSLDALDNIYKLLPGVATMISNAYNIGRVIHYADLVLATVLVPGERTPLLISREMLRQMKPRAVIIDMDIDEGGCVETARPTTIEEPTYIEEDVIHYCVPNMPSLVARTSTYAFVNAAMPFIQEMVLKGVNRAIDENPAIEKGVGTYQGEIRHISSFASHA